MKKRKKSRIQHLSLKALAGALVMAQAVPFATGASAASADPFNDVPAGHWAGPAIASLKAQGIISGRSSTTFAPNDNITRAEFATLLVKSMKLPLDQDTTPIFTDVNRSHFAFTFIQTAYHNNLVKGVAPGKFDPNSQISRQDMATMITNALKIGPVPDTLLQSALAFSDVNDIDKYAKNPVAVSSYLEVIKGYGDKTFRPQNNATRAEASSMLFNMLNVPTDKIRQLKEMANPTVKSIEITPNPITLAIGETQALTAKAYDGNHQPVDNVTVSWALNGDIGTLSNGSFTAVKPGTGTITATVKKDGQEPMTATVNVTVEQPKHLKFDQADLGSFKPTQPIQISVKVNDDKGQFLQADNNRKLTLTVDGPDGQSKVEATTVNGVASFTLNKTKAGSYSVSVSGAACVTDNTAAFKVVAGDFAKLKMYVAHSTFVRANTTVLLNSKGYDQWDNEVSTTSPISFSISDSSRGVIGSTGNPTIGTFTAGNTKGNVTVTAQYGGKSVSQQIMVYTAATDVVSGKGDWMMWRDWKNYPVQDTINRLKNAGVTHVYLLVTTTTDGFFGQDSMDDFLHQAHAAGIAVIGWVYAANADPYADANKTVETLNYMTPYGQRFDGLAADLEEHLDAYHQEEYAKAVRNAMGPNYPMMAVVYPATWDKVQPWTVYPKYYDIVAPMLYWHYKERPYTYQETYDAVAAEMVKIRQVTGGNMPVHMIGQSYNMFTTSNQNPTWAEIQAAMKAAKDNGAVGYSTYRGRTATTEGWNEFGGFQW